jgi:hypothetical protein
MLRGLNSIKHKETLMHMGNNILVKSVLFCLLTVNSGITEDRIEVRGGGMYFSPNGAAATGSEDSGLQEVKWDSGTGLELQGVYWPDNSIWGYGLSVGTASWDIDDYFSVDFDPSGLDFINSLEGDVDLTTFGISIFRKLTANKDEAVKYNADLEAGIRYLSVDSGIEGLFGVGIDGTIVDAQYQTIELDDSVVAVLALNGNYLLTETASVFATVGVQLDIDKGAADNEVPGTGTYEAGDSEYQAVYGRIGLSILL